MDSLDHLYRRAGFGLSPAEWEERRNWSQAAAVADLFQQASGAGFVAEPEVPAFDPRQLDKEAIADLRRDERQKTFSMASDWIYRMADPGQAAPTERMSLFWH